MFMIDKYSAAGFRVRLAPALLLFCSAIAFPHDADDPPETVIGERLFLETRFAQAFKAYLDAGGRVSEPVPAGDPVVATTETTGEPLPGPFAGRTINCRSCHLVDEHVDTPGGGMRAYNDFAPDFPDPQTRIYHILCVEQQIEALGGLSGAGFGAAACAPDLLLAKAIARFKTPGLRDLGHGEPYMHNGHFDSVEDVIAFYRRGAAMARAGSLRNPALEIRHIALVEADEAPLAAFLKSPNEDYE
ncbi:MAG: hypothetical protein KIT09_17005 [Bryobacteraceae bacterium]|nr:hypothetical protein [Bryobacteraceae bacterium]